MNALIIEENQILPYSVFFLLFRPISLLERISIMAKQKITNAGNKTTKSAPAPAKKAAKPSSAKVVAKKVSKPVAKPAAKSTPASKSKSVAKPQSGKAKPILKKPVPTVKKVEEKKKVAVVEKSKSVAKPASKPAEKTSSKPTVPVKTPAVQKTEAKPAAVSHSAALNLPPLPRSFRIGKKKGKIIPGEKRIVKLETINHHVIKDKPIEIEKNAKAEPKGKFTVEQPIRSTVQFLYDFLSTPNGLIEWFSDEAELNGDTYTFKWDGAAQQAKIINAKLDSYIRMRWLDKPAGTYFEMRIDVDPITAEIMLVITDFGENENDIRNLRALWETQIQQLLKALVTY
jgi:hypothetical protein